MFACQGVAKDGDEPANLALAGNGNQPVDLASAGKENPPVDLASMRHVGNLADIKRSGCHGSARVLKTLQRLACLQMRCHRPHQQARSHLQSVMTRLRKLKSRRIKEPSLRRM